MYEILFNEKNFENFDRFSLKKMDQLFTHLGPKMKPYYFVKLFKKNNNYQNNKLIIF